jgi:hypothetical protein
MFCCACAGVCNHIGPHSYCSAHGGGYGIPTYTGSSTSSPVLPYMPCNHCWCERAILYPNHAQCCKCGDRLHFRFVRRAVPSTEETHK